MISLTTSNPAFAVEWVVRKLCTEDGKLVYDGCYFDPDGQKSIVVYLTTPCGSSATCKIIRKVKNHNSWRIFL